MSAYEEVLKQLPEKIAKLLEKDIFDLDGVDDKILTEYLFYIPEVSRLIGLTLAHKKQIKNKLEFKLDKIRSRVLLNLIDDIDAHKYKNEKLREAKVIADPEYQKTKLMLIEIEKQIDELKEVIWKFKNLMMGLSDIARLRVSEKKML